MFAPVDGNVNFLLGDLQGGTLVLFDDSDQSYAGSFLNIPVSSVVGITGPNGNGDFIATNSLAQTLVLTGSNQFILGLFSGGQWFADSNVIDRGANSYTVVFGSGPSVLQASGRAGRATSARTPARRGAAACWGSPASPAGFAYSVRDSDTS